MNDISLVDSFKQPALIPSQAVSCLQLDGINPLVAAAMPLLLLMIKLRQISSMNVDAMLILRHRIMNEFMAFIETCRKLAYSTRIIFAAQYCLCTAVDEAALSTDWGNNSIWSNQTLLSTMQQETWGGERFFIILEEMAKEPTENGDVLELLYLILSLGFEGRYYDQSTATRDEIRRQLFYIITPRAEVCPKTPLPNIAGKIKGIWSIRRLLVISMTLLVTGWLACNAATWLTSKEILRSLRLVVPTFEQLY